MDETQVAARPADDADVPVSRHPFEDVAENVDRPVEVDDHRLRAFPLRNDCVPHQEVDVAADVGRGQEIVPVRTIGIGQAQRLGRPHGQRNADGRRDAGDVVGDGDTLGADEPGGGTDACAERGELRRLEISCEELQQGRSVEGDELILLRQVGRGLAQRQPIEPDRNVETRLGAVADRCPRRKPPLGGLQ